MNCLSLFGERLKMMKKVKKAYFRSKMGPKSLVISRSTGFQKVVRFWSKSLKELAKK